MPADPGDLRDYEDKEERRRMQAVAHLRWEIRAKVYPECDWDRPRNYADDDPLDPVIDYHILKDKLYCVLILKNYNPLYDELDYPWQAHAPFDWAPLDALHATIAAGDPVMQRFLAAGGDPQPTASTCYVEVSDSE
ncbi:hypothetical protein EV714DRAFT_278290 [Schizophyllum commune]